jgi:hypothetical protein
MPVLASYALPGGGELEIFEPSPGDFIIGQRIPADAVAPALDGPASTLSQLYSRHFPGRAVPVELREAELRQARFEAESAQLEPILERLEALPLLSGDRDEGSRARAAEAPRNVSDFKNRRCMDASSSYVSFSYCRTEKTNDGSVYEDDVNGVYTAARPYRGNITLRLRYRPRWSWETQFSRTVSQGETYHAVRSNSSRDFDIESKVGDAAGDGYHHSTFGTKSENAAGCYSDVDYAGCRVTPQ